MTIAIYAIQAFNLVKAAIEAGIAVKHVYDIIDRTNAALKTMDDENRAPSESEWNALNAESENLRAQRPDLDEEN